MKHSSVTHFIQLVLSFFPPDFHLCTGIYSCMSKGWAEHKTKWSKVLASILNYSCSWFWLRFNYPDSPEFTPLNFDLQWAMFFLLIRAVAMATALIDIRGELSWKHGALFCCSNWLNQDEGLFRFRIWRNHVLCSNMLWSFFCAVLASNSCIYEVFMKFQKILPKCASQITSFRLIAKTN